MIPRLDAFPKEKPRAPVAKKAPALETRADAPKKEKLEDMGEYAAVIQELRQGLGQALDIIAKKRFSLAKSRAKEEQLKKRIKELELRAEEQRQELERLRAEPSAEALGEDTANYVALLLRLHAADQGAGK